ncbi:MAG TPA: LysR family transcriptional regulator [Burkholderiaceae bacterium]|nr:LysR family transcriptional regulator [Burkholderiaceae bacterium]
MEFRHLKYFLALAEELHFGRAAKRLAISQPPLSFNIKQLEDDLGVRLFERNSKGVQLTAAGEAFRTVARKLLDGAEEAKTLIREVEAGVIGHLRVGFAGSMLFRGLPQMLQVFGKAAPKVRVELRELNSREQIDELLHEGLDVGFVLTAKVPPPLQSRKIASEPFVACLPKAHPLARRKVVSAADLQHEPFALFARAASPDYYERVISICVTDGFHPTVAHEVRHWLSVVSLVAQGMGVSLVPQALEHAGMQGIVFVPLRRSNVTCESWCVWQSARSNVALNRFLGVVKAGATI